MAAWDIRKFVLACDHFDQPGVSVIMGQIGLATITSVLDKSQRCTARFDLGFDLGSRRAKVRDAAAKKGWTHVHEPGAPYVNGKDYCPRHKPEA